MGREDGIEEEADERGMLGLQARAVAKQIRRGAGDQVSG